MIRWIALLVLVGITASFLVINNLQEEKINKDSEFGKTSILQAGQEFINRASPAESVEENILGTVREITQEEILKETEIPDLKEDEKILKNGIRLSAGYNHASLEYESGKYTAKEYLGKLFDFRIKYEKYMTAVDSYIGQEDILIQKNSMAKELEEIIQQITLLSNSFDIEDGWESISEYEKYKKFLPSMFAP